MIMKQENVRVSNMYKESITSLSHKFADLRDYTNDEINNCRNDFERIIKKISWQRRTKTRRRR